MKKYIITMLLTSLILSLFACSAPTGADVDTEASTDVQSSETVVDAETTAEYVAPTQKFDGVEQTVASYGVVSNWMSLKYTDAYAESENGDVLNDAIYFRNRDVEETLGVKILYHNMGDTLGDPSALSTMILAGDDIIDMAYLNSSSLPKVLGQDMFCDLLSETDIDFGKSWWDHNAVEEYTLGDKLFCATGDIGLFLYYSPIAMFTNKQLVSDLNLGNPYELVKSGGWTLDKMIEYCTKAASDIDGDSQMTIDDRYGLLCEGKSLPILVQASGIKFSEKNADGIPEITVNTEKTINIVEKMVPFMRNKEINMISNDYSKQYGSVFTELYLPLFCDNRALFYKNQLHISLNLRDMESDFGILPLPKYDETQDEYYGVLNDYFTTFITMPITNANTEVTSMLAEAMGYFGQKYVTPAFMDVTITGKTIRDDASIEMLEIIFANKVYDLASIYNWGGVYSLVTNLANKSQTDFASQYAANEAKIQAALDETLESLSLE